MKQPVRTSRDDRWRESRAPHDPPSVIFIVGVGRSGTSLLQSILHAHPAITCLPETHFFRRYVARFLVRRGVEIGGVGRFLAKLEEDPEFDRLGLEPRTLLKPYLNNRRPFRLPDVYRRLLAVHRDRADEVRYVGEKDPRVLDYLGELRVLLPGVRVLHIIRDPRDVLLSRMKAGWSEQYPWLLHPMIYRAQLTWGRMTGMRSFGKDYREIRYEDLLVDPERELSAVCDWLGLRFSPTMLKFGDSAADLVSEEEKDWKRETMGPLLKDNRGKWRSELPTFKVRFAEAVCGDLMDDLGYAASSPDGSATDLDRWVMKLAFPAARLFTWAYRVRP